MAFRRLTDEEEALGYQVLVDNVAWQRAKGIMLWDRPLPAKVYAERQQRGENYGLFVEGSLAVVVSLVGAIPGYWSAFVDDPNAVWLCTLAVAEGFHGKGLGKLTVQQALAWLQEAGHAVMWLDCTTGFLEGFYASLGFVAVTRGKRFIPHAGRDFDCVLFKTLLV